MRNALTFKGAVMKRGLRPHYEGSEREWKTAREQHEDLNDEK